MIGYVDKSNFISWFLNQFYTIGAQLIDHLDNIGIYNNVSLLDFIIAITIIGAFIPIVLTIARPVNRATARYERRKAKEK